MTIRIYLFLINVLIAFIGLPLDHAIASGGKPQSSHQNEVKNPSELNKDIKNKLTALISQCDYESNINNSEATFDSLFCDAISLAESTFDPKLLLDIYLKYIDRVNSRSKTLDFKKLVEKTESLALEFQDENQRISTWIIISKGANELRYASIAQKYALKALSELDIEHDSKRKVEANLCLGKSFEIQNLPKEAYQNYLNALYETEFIESKSDYDNTVLV
ncbi:MAG TPA: hypothetical protein ENK91_00555, partial [Bacteroidetes bacterium]|nr:hypothetical protein [Bacteroidota bacterium]